MPEPKKVLPTFRSDAEEREFWDNNNVEDWIEGPGDLIIRIKKQPKRTVTMRMDEALYHDLRAVADRHEVPYQRLMQELLRKSLREFVAEERSKSPRKRRGTPAVAPATNS